jgi:uncharacterized membrane protein (DUF2068 family)
MLAAKRQNFLGSMLRSTESGDVLSSNASRRVVKSVALFEATKGVIVLLAGFGLLSLLHHDLRALAIALVGRLHMDASHHYPSVFIEAASRTTDARLWSIATIGFVYAIFRFVEAYGLWFCRTWAEWLALVSGGIYLPLEVYEIIQRITWMRVSALIANLVVVVAIALVLWHNRRTATPIKS